MLDPRAPIGLAALDERDAKALEEARREWRLKLASVPLAAGVILALAWLVGEMSIATVGIPLSVLSWSLPRLLMGPQGQLRSEVTETVMDVLAKRRPMEDLMERGLPPAERIEHLRSVCDLLEVPEGMFGIRARTLGVIGVGLGVVGWGGFGVASAVFGEWGTAGVSFAASLTFLVAGLVGRRKDGFRYDVLRLVEEEVHGLDRRRSPEQVAGASG